MGLSRVVKVLAPLVLGVFPSAASGQAATEVLTFSAEVSLPLERAFALWLDPEAASTFLATEVRIQPWEGGRYEAVFAPDDDPAGALQGTYGSRILTLDEPERLIFEWKALTPPRAAQELGGLQIRLESRVEVTFEAVEESRTRVHIEHSAPVRDDPCVRRHWEAASRFWKEVGWPWVVDRLEARFGGAAAKVS